MEKYNSDIESLKKILSSLRPLTQGELKRFRDDFLIDYTYNTNAIEGNTLTLRETAMVLNDGITISKKPLKDHLEAIGHKEAFEYVEEMVRNQSSLSESLIKDIHSLVLMDQPRDKGKYRSVPVSIMGAIHETAQPWDVPIQMEKLLFSYNKEKVFSFEKTARFHLELEAIHPFIDGNGRTGRLILNLELMKAGYLPINIKYVDVESYYECFSFYHQNGKNPEKLTHLISTYEKQELIRYIGILQQIKEVEREY